MRFQLTASLWACCLALLAAAAGAAEQRGRYTGAKEVELPGWFKESFLDFEEDIAEAAANRKRVVLYFHQRGCPYCARLIEHNLSQKDIVDTLRRRFDVIAINLWGDREVVTVGGRHYTEKRLAEALKVHYTPTLLFFDEAGKPALRLNGYYPPHQFRVALDYVAGAQEKELGYADYVRRRAPEPPAGRLHDEPFFSAPPHDLGRSAGQPAERPLAVYFEQAECPACDDFHAKVLADPEVRALAGRFESVQLDLWADTPVVTPDGRRTTARDWARDLGIAYAPSLVLFDRAGREVMRSDAFLKRFHVESVLDYVLSGAYRDEPSFQRYISARAERLVEQGRDVNIWE